MSQTRYVIRILDDAHYWSRTFDPKHPHLEQWVVEFDCDTGIKTSLDPADAKVFPSRAATRKYWLRECPPGKPWDYWESGIEGDGHSMPLARYMVTTETITEALKLASSSEPEERWQRRLDHALGVTRGDG